MTIGCNMICLKLNWFFYGLSRMLQFSQFVWTLRSSIWDVFNNFLLSDATDRTKISSDQKRFFIALSLYPLSFFANHPNPGSFKPWIIQYLDHPNPESSKPFGSFKPWIIQYLDHPNPELFNTWIILQDHIIQILNHPKPGSSSRI